MARADAGADVITPSPILSHRSLKGVAAASHVALLRVLRVSDTGDKTGPPLRHIKVQMEVKRVLRGRVREAEGARFEFIAKAYFGPIRSLPVAAVGALWLNHVPDVGSSLYFIEKRAQAGDMISLAEELGRSEKRAWSLEAFDREDDAIPWALQSAGTAHAANEWLLEMRAVGSRRLHFRMLWPGAGPSELMTPHLLLPGRVVNRALFDIQVKDAAGHGVAYRGPTTDWAAGGVDDIALDPWTLVEGEMDLHEWFAWRPTPAIAPASAWDEKPSALNRCATRGCSAARLPIPGT